MQKVKIQFGIILLTFLAILGITVTTGHAKSNIKVYWDNHNDLLNTTHMYTAPQIQKGKQTAYIWNFNHTKHIHKLNNYKYTEWNMYGAASVPIKHRRAIYYKISNRGSIRGLVYYKYVSLALAKSVNSFTSDSSYLNYLKTSPSQKLSRQILKLFPNSKVSLDLSKQIAREQPNPRTGTTSLQGLTNELDFGSFKLAYRRDKTSYLKNIQLFNSTPNTFLNSTYLYPATERVRDVAKMLNAVGYTADQRAQMGNYQIGICIYDQVGDQDHYKNNSIIYPGKGTSLFYLTYKVVLAKKDN
ncbi:hypothetical protein G8J22_02711 [Lentilactobacillus hilgardii]|uniref:hypothetical protein n=1 Tax=Lentilactobacillus hilgardii TaxID=1588 RepID=UPI00019C5790|nr:hypothetical protein [Lentilactobacillus hilgardii]EEI21130.1 hypothetical protein HMPREF0497_0198 [Lentilactobacillus buchneri ATCC 11577]MCT3396212.1 hypothetical protein [Lentilactobacillus hilgardii]QIR10700.1 hypothetical protein G8J22_02711 [Lentilactobacillus hilgardii]